MLPNESRPAQTDGALTALVRRAAAAAAHRPRLTIGLWILLVCGCLAAGSATGTKTLEGAETGVGESRRADERIAAAGLRRPATETVLVRSESARATARAGPGRSPDSGRRTRA